MPKEMYINQSLIASNFTKTTETLEKLQLNDPDVLMNTDILVFKDAFEAERSDMKGNEENYIPLISKLIIIDKDTPDLIWLYDEGYCPNKPQDKITLLGGHVDKRDLDISDDFIDAFSVALYRELAEELYGFDLDFITESPIYSYTDGMAWDVLPEILSSAGVNTTNQLCMEKNKNHLWYHYIENGSFCIYHVIKATVDFHEVVYGRWTPYTRDDFELGNYQIRKAKCDIRDVSEPFDIIPKIIFGTSELFK